jgi:hypothetical protein
MDDRRHHRASLLLALIGALLMLAAAADRVARTATDETLPRFKTSQPALPDWPRHSPGALA